MSTSTSKYARIIMSRNPATFLQLTSGYFSLKLAGIFFTASPMISRLLAIAFFLKALVLILSLTIFFENDSILLIYSNISIMNS